MTIEKEAFNIFNMGRNTPRFLTNVKNATLSNDTKINPLSDEKIQGELKRHLIHDGNGFFGDMGLGAVGLFSKGTKEKLKGKIADAKLKLSDMDQRAAQKVLNTTKAKEGGKLHKSLTVRKPMAVAEYKQTKGVPGGESVEESRLLYDNDVRIPSLLAPAQNTAKMATPVLASMFVADKLYSNQEKQASEKAENEKTGLNLETVGDNLDKVAAMQKVAMLEEKLDVAEYMLKSAKEETSLYRSRLEQEVFEKEAALSKTAELEQRLLDKEAQYDEMFLRTKARERSKTAVKVAETMLETGLIKQAQFDNKVDYLMDCDDQTFELYNNLAKTASVGEKGLESSPFLIENVNREEKPHYQTGLSSKGQSIGEAAMDLMKK